MCVLIYYTVSILKLKPHGIVAFRVFTVERHSREWISLDGVCRAIHSLTATLQIQPFPVKYIVVSSLISYSLYFIVMKTVLTRTAYT